MDPKEYITIAMAAGGLILGIVNFVRTSRISDRQHALTYAGDISKWATDIVKILPRAMNMYNLQRSRQDRLNGCVLLGNELISLYDQSAFLFPDSSHKAPAALQRMIDAVQEDKAQLKDHDLLISDALKLDGLRTDLTEAVRETIMVSKRHRDAQKYLS